MPLIIAVLIIIVIIVNGVESSKKHSATLALHEKDRRKTNAKLEHQTLDMYMKHGHSFDESFRRAYEYMIENGYDPCIPRSAYHNRENVESSSCGIYGGRDVERYDSFWVQERRNHVKLRWLEAHPGASITPDVSKALELLVYENFPTTEAQYLQDLKHFAALSSAEPVGSFIIYPGLGTCEVLAHNWLSDCSTQGTYSLRVLKTGQIVHHVRIGDKKIQRQT